MLGKWAKKDQNSMQFKSLIPATAAGGGLSSSMYGVKRTSTVAQSIDQGLVWAVLALLFLLICGPALSRQPLLLSTNGEQCLYIALDC